MSSLHMIFTSIGSLNSNATEEINDTMKRKSNKKARKNQIADRQ